MRRVALLLLILTAGCSPIERPLVIGTKDFAEQQIAAQLLAQTLRANDIPAEVDRISRDSLDTIAALWLGDIDVYVEYTGSLLALIGHPPVSEVAESFAVAREQAAKYGFALQPLLGFRNDYVVLARPGSEVAASASRLSDLASQREPLRLGMTADFRARSRDGFDALLRRYGWSAEATMVVPSSAEDKDTLYSALLDGDVDLVVGFLTDPQIDTFGLVQIADDRGFFPAYAAAPLTRTKLLDRRPEVGQALETLSQRLSTDDMKAMVTRVVDDGADPFLVAAQYLDPDIVPVSGEPAGRAVSLALGGLDAPAGQSAKALMALRKAFPGRSIEVVRVIDPLAALLESKVRYALLSSPEFFRTDGDGPLSLRGPADALLPAGFDALHLLTATNTPPTNGSGSVMRIGVGPQDGVTARTAAMVISGIANTTLDPVPHPGTSATAYGEQAEQVRSGDLDGLFIMAEIGHPMIGDLIDSGLRLEAFPAWETRGNRVRFPFLEPLTIPGGTYPGQAAPLVSVGSQTVLAMRRPDLDNAVGVVGPGSAAIGRTLPVGAGTVKRIRDAMQTEAHLDPSLPVARAAREPPPEGPPSITPSPIGSIFNLAAIVVLALILWLYLQPSSRRRR